MGTENEADNTRTTSVVSGHTDTKNVLMDRGGSFTMNTSSDFISPDSAQEPNINTSQSIKKLLTSTALTLAGQRADLRCHCVSGVICYSSQWQVRIVGEWNGIFDHNPHKLRPFPAQRVVHQHWVLNNRRLVSDVQQQTVLSLLQGWR